MNFYIIEPRDGYIDYDTSASDKQLTGSPEIVGGYRKIVRGPLCEYKWEGARAKTMKQGDLHMSSGLVFANSAALGLMEVAANDKIEKFSVPIKGREGEDFWQVFVLNFVNCLDLENTTASPSSKHWKDKIGVIKKPVINENLWDGSHLFVVPQDPSYLLFCTEEFVRRWKSSKLKGAKFVRFLFDPQPILA